MLLAQSYPYCIDECRPLVSICNPFQIADHAASSGMLWKRLVPQSGMTIGQHQKSKICNGQGFGLPRAHRVGELLRDLGHGFEQALIGINQLWIEQLAVRSIGDMCGREWGIGSRFRFRRERSGALAAAIPAQLGFQRAHLFEQRDAYRVRQSRCRRRTHIIAGEGLERQQKHRQACEVELHS